VPFVVFAPPRLPDGSQSHIMYIPPRFPRSTEWHLTLMYMGTQWCRFLWLTEGTTPDPESDNLEWEAVSVGDRAMRISDPGPNGVRVVAFEDQGTHVAVWSDLGRERILDLAASLTPVPRRGDRS
jgi:hypothetical protein